MKAESIRRFIPFRMRYWVIYHNPHRRMMVVRARIKPRNAYAYRMLDALCLDGPFDTQEDAVHSLNFWRAQYNPGRCYT